MIEQIQQLAKQLKTEIIAIREQIHANPELSFEEYNTSLLVENYLKDLGLNPQRIANTGVWAMINGNGKSHKTIALRADLDALPITEKGNHTYISKNEGVIHSILY